MLHAELITAAAEHGFKIQVDQTSYDDRNA